MSTAVLHALLCAGEWRAYGNLLYDTAQAEHRRAAVSKAPLHSPLDAAKPRK